MILEPGEKVLVIERRLFESDVRRSFVGEVQQAEGFAFRLKGQKFIFDGNKGTFLKKGEARERVFSYSPFLIISLLHRDFAVHKANYKNTEKGTIMTDGEHYLEVSEFGAR